MKKTIINELNIEGYKKLHEEMLKINNLEHRSVISTISMSVIGFVAPIMLSIALKEFIIVFLLLSLAIETCLLPYALINLSILKKNRINIMNSISKEYPDIDTEIGVLELQKRLETIKETEINKNHIDQKNDEVVEYNTHDLADDSQISNKPAIKIKRMK